MKILMILSKPCAHDSRVLNEARSLVSAGHELTFLTWDNSKNSRNDGIDGINIIRMPSTVLMRFLHYRFFSLPFWYNAAYRKAEELHNEKKFDVVHCHDLDTLPIGIRLKKKFNIFLIYDAHEIYGYMILDGPFELFSKYFIWKEKNILKHIDALITTEETKKEYFNKLTSKPVFVIMNCKPLQGAEYQRPDNAIFTLVYLGALHKSRLILETIEIIKSIPSVYYIIGGSGYKKYVDRIKQRVHQAPNIRFVGEIPVENVLTETKKADAVIQMIDPKRLNARIALSNKVFEAMSCGRPILSSQGTFAGEFVAKEKIGLTAPCIKKHIKEAIIRLRDDPGLREVLGRSAFKAAVEKYNWEKESKKLIKIYESAKQQK